jgi:ABC-type transporter Mla subunit MlaD
MRVPIFHMPAAFEHPSTWAPMLFMLLLGILTSLTLVRAARNVRRAIEENDKRFSGTLALALRGPEGGAQTDGRRLLAGFGGIVEPTHADEKRWAVQGTQTELEQIYADACDDALQGEGLWTRLVIGIGHSLTGVALILTFALIAWVLVTEVPGAIQGVAVSGESQEGTVALQRAISLIGAKFVVSALGLALSLVFRGLLAWERGQIAAAVHASLRRHRSLFVGADAYRFDLLRADLNSGQGQLREAVLASTESVSERLLQLGSIEVSVKDMGNEVKAHLGSLMKQHVADQIADAVGELRAYADQVVQRIESGLTESFTRLVTSGVEQLTATLVAIRETIERQTQSDIERLIGEMRDMMTGGFETESRQMAQAMTSLTEVLPRLETQLRGLVVDMSREMQARTDEGQRVHLELGRQVEGLVAASRNSQQAIEGLLARIAEVTEESTGALHARLSASGEAVVERVLSASEAGVSNLRGEFGRLVQVAGENIATFSRQVDTTRESLAGVRSMFQDALADLRAMATDLHTSLDGARNGLVTAERTANTFASAGGLIHEMARTTQDTVRTLGDRLGEEAELVAKHGALARQIREVVVPAFEQVFVAHADGTAEQVRKLHESWQQLAERVRETVDACGAGLQESVEQLAEQVELLRELLKPRANGR